MGILSKLCGFTPFYNRYKRYKQQQAHNYHQKLEEKIFPSRVLFYQQLVKPNELVFDVGANIGNRVEALLKCGAKIVAVEPQPSCVEVLNERFGDKIRIENVGLSDQMGELDMLIANDSTVSTFSKDFVKKNNSRFKYSKWEKTLKVPVTTMDSIIEKYGVPKFCKIDVEGFELQVLKGLHTKIPIISIEYCVPEMQEQNLECLQYLHKLSPKALYNYSVGESMVWASKDWKNYEDFLQVATSEEFIHSSFGDIYIKSI